MEINLCHSEQRLSCLCLCLSILKSTANNQCINFQSVSHLMSEINEDKCVAKGFCYTQGKETQARLGLTVLTTQLCPLLVLPSHEAAQEVSCLSDYTLSTGHQHCCLLSPGEENTGIWKMKLFRLSALQHTSKIRASFTYTLHLVSSHGITVMMDSMTCTSQNWWNSTQHLTSRKNTPTEVGTSILAFSKFYCSLAIFNMSRDVPEGFLSTQSPKWGREYEIICTVAFLTR